MTELGQRRAELVRGLDVRVVGDPGHLEAPPLPPARESGPPMVSAELAVAVVERAIAVLHEQHTADLADRDRRIAELTTELERRSARRPVEDHSGRELLRLAADRARHRLRRG